MRPSRPDPAAVDGPAPLDRGDAHGRSGRILIALPRAEQEQTVGALVGLSYHYVDEAFSVALLEALKMTNALQSLLEDTVARGIEQGVAQGIEQGVAQGKAEEARRLLRLTIAQRFGAIPAALERRIALADLGTLDRMFEQSLSASSIEAIEQA